MSNIRNISTQNLLSSLAGAQRTDQAKERASTESKQAQQHQDILQLSIQKSDNIADTNSSTDRDAQGFYLPDQDQPEQQPQTEEQSKIDKPLDNNDKAPSFNPDLGNALDLEA